MAAPLAQWLEQHLKGRKGVPSGCYRGNGNGFGAIKRESLPELWERLIAESGLQRMTPAVTRHRARAASNAMRPD